MPLQNHQTIAKGVRINVFGIFVGNTRYTPGDEEQFVTTFLDEIEELEQSGKLVATDAKTLPEYE